MVETFAEKTFKNVLKDHTRKVEQYRDKAPPFPERAICHVRGCVRGSNHGRCELSKHFKNPDVHPGVVYDVRNVITVLYADWLRDDGLDATARATTEEEFYDIMRQNLANAAVDVDADVSMHTDITGASTLETVTDEMSVVSHISRGEEEPTIISTIACAPEAVVDEMSLASQTSQGEDESTIIRDYNTSDTATPGVASIAGDIEVSDDSMTGMEVALASLEKVHVEIGKQKDILAEKIQTKKLKKKAMTFASTAKGEEVDEEKASDCGESMDESYNSVIYLLGQMNL